MKRFLILILLVLQAGFISAQDNDNHVGSYNPEEDMTRYNDTVGPDLLFWWGERIFLRSSPEEELEMHPVSRYDKYYNVLARIIFLLLLHLLYTRLGLIKPKYNKDVNKVIYRYKTVLIVFSVLCVFTTIQDSLILGILMAAVAFWLVATLVAKFRRRLCPECCTYGHIRTEQVPLDDYTNEIHGLTTHTSQFLNADQIKPESLPKEEYKIYVVQKHRCNHHCTKCNSKWNTEVWKRIKELV